MRQRVEYFAIGLIAGAVFGIVVGLLVAPTSGAQVRRRIADEARRAAQLAREVAERAERSAESIGGRVDHYLGKDEDVAWRKVHEIREGVQRYTSTQSSE